jgi:AcrR family transcriptional regulator
MSRERAILDAATEAFYEKGFHGVGVDELGVRAGVRGPSIYRHFSSKDEILATLLNGALDELTRAATPATGNAHLDLERAIQHHIAFAIERRQLVLIYQRDAGSMADPWRAEVAERQARYDARWEALFQARFPNLDGGTAAAVSQSCLGTIFSSASWPARAANAERVPQTLERLVFQGLASLD